MIFLAIFNLIFRNHTEPLASQVARFALLIANLFFILGIVALVIAITSSPSVNSRSEYFELIMWGGGHLFQHSASIYLVVVWQSLLHYMDSPVLSRNQFLIVLFSFSWPLILLPGILLSPIDSSEYRLGFTWFMRWGIFPGFMVYLTLFIWNFCKLYKQNLPQKFPQGRYSLYGSMLLIIIGMTFGAFIEGSDLRIPGHYHASIGGITVAFMGVSLAFLTNDNQIFKLLRKAIQVYVPGQILFSSGMFAAGYFGVERKTYGAGLIIQTSSQKISFMILGIGGVVAFIGGALFFIAFIKVLRANWNGNKSS